MRRPSAGAGGLLTIPWTNEGRFRDVLDVTWDSLKKRAREATRTSFVERLRNWRDDATWAEFMQRYGRIVRGVAIRAGLRPDEAEDVVQETAASVAKKMPTFEYDKGRSSFENWVRHVTALRIKDQLRRRMQGVGAESDTAGTGTLERLPDMRVSEEQQSAWDEAWRREVMDRALERVQLKVKPAHYQVFYLSVVDGRPGPEVARTLGVSLPNVYIVRHRVLGVLRGEVERIRRTPGGLG